MDVRCKKRLDDRRVLGGLRRSQWTEEDTLQIALCAGSSDSQARQNGWMREASKRSSSLRKNRKTQYDYDKAIYKQRNIVERMFCRLKDWRRIATRFDRMLKTFMAAIALAAIVIRWL